MLWVLDQPISCWGPWLKWAQLGGDSKGPSASANLRLGPASSVNSATLVSPAHSYRTLYRILVLKQFYFFLVFKSSFAASCAETSRNAWCNKVSILTRLYAVIHYLMLICNILLLYPCFWITLTVIHLCALPVSCFLLHHHLHLESAGWWKDHL